LVLGLCIGKVEGVERDRLIESHRSSRRTGNWNKKAEKMVMPMPVSPDKRGV
jgi:hypothetical protein